MDAVGKAPAQLRRNSYTQMLAEDRFRPDDIYIAVMGMTGSGKSSLIATCCPEAESEIGHALESKTTAVRLWTLEQEGLQVHLIDTPGFDDTNRSDSDVLKDLAYWLGISYEKKKIQLTGLIYLHPITHVRMAGTPFKNLRTFRKMVGSGSMSSVALVTTMWGPSCGKEEEDRDMLLQSTPQYWGNMIKEGARAHRHFGDRASAIKIIAPLLKKKPTVLNLQKELVIEKKDLNNTDAGREVDAEMTLQREALERKIEATKEEMSQALAAKDEKWVQDLAADQEKYQKQIEDTKSAQEEMKLSMAKIFAEKEEQYKQSIKEMDEKLQDFELKHAAREKQYEAVKEAARLEKEEAERKAAEQELEIDKARSETEEAQQDKYAAQLAMIFTLLKEDKERDQEYQSAVLLAQKQKNEELTAIQKETERIREEREQIALRQQEHNQAMMMQQFQYQQGQAQAQAQAQAQMWRQQQQQAYYDNQAAQNVTMAAAAGGILGTAAIAQSRIVNTQPTYDFLAGNSAVAPSVSGQREPLGQSFRQSQAAKPDIGNEDLRAQVKTLQYELESFKQERELSKLRHDKELRDVQLKAEELFRKAQAEENSRHVPSHKYDALKRELKDSQDQAINQQNTLEKRLRTAQEDGRAAKEESEEIQTEFEGLSRQHKHQMQEIESKHSTLQKTLSDLRDDLANKDFTLHTTQERLSQRETETGQLESEILRLKAQTGDADTLAVIKRELSEQVSHIRKLESTNREQNAELKHFRRVHKAVEVVEEEKRALENKVSLMSDIEKKLREAQLQRQILEDERRSWTSYLENEGGTGKVEFDSPEDMARALVKEQLENASLLQRIGAVQPELLEKDEIIKSLEEERGKIHSEMEKLRSSGVSGNDSRAKIRLERQRTLAVKEVDLLREQLRTFDSEEQTYHSENQFDTIKCQRIADLEALVDQHRTELQTLNTELSTLENRAPAAPQSPLKRQREEAADDHQLGQLSRKNRKLQDALSSLQSTYALLQTEHAALQSQLSSLQKSAKTRILSLRSNPSDSFEATKLSTLTTLRQENKDLLAQLENRYDAASTKLVPQSTLENLRLEMQELEQQVKDKEKRMLRLKEIFGKKSLEFREAVFSLLGWKTDFRPNGKVALSLNTGNDGDEVEECIIFDGENGTMKIAGGPDSAFALQIRPLVRQWVEGRRYIPGLMAGIILSKVEDGTLVI